MSVYTIGIEELVGSVRRSLTIKLLSDSSFGSKCLEWVHSSVMIPQDTLAFVELLQTSLEISGKY